MIGRTVPRSTAAGSVALPPAEHLGFGVVGEQYVPVQNEELCELLDAVVDEGGAHFETAGSLRGGRQVFVSMKFPAGIKVGGPARTYMEAVMALPAWQEWRTAALKEPWVLPKDEPDWPQVPRVDR